MGHQRGSRGGQKHLTVRIEGERYITGDATIFADWEREAVPWLTMTGRGENAQVQVSHPELLQPLTVQTRPLGQPW